MVSKNNIDTNKEDLSTFNPFMVGVDLWQSAAMYWITTYNEFVKGASRMAEYWFNRFWNPWTESEEGEKSDKVKIGNQRQQEEEKNNKDQQIPTEHNQEQTQRAIHKQNKVPGETRSKTINDFPYAAAIAQALKDLEFPANKNRIIQYLQLQQSTNPESREVLSVLQQIEEEKQYKNVADVTKAAGLVEEE